MENKDTELEKSLSKYAGNMTISSRRPWDTGFQFREDEQLQQHLQYIIHVFIVIVIFYNCVRVMVDPLKIFWVLTNSTYLGENGFIGILCFTSWDLPTIV